ncbi:MAG: hypothetical protein V9H69_05065 [Anaerolineae bacterium]
MRKSTAIGRRTAEVTRCNQDAIDRRFYCKKYNAQQVLARFAHTARDETDLDALTAELARVVQETLQPESVSVWLRPIANLQQGAAANGVQPAQEMQR